MMRSYSKNVGAVISVGWMLVSACGPAAPDASEAVALVSVRTAALAELEAALTREASGLVASLVSLQGPVCPGIEGGDPSEGAEGWAAAVTCAKQAKENAQKRAELAADFGGRLGAVAAEAGFRRGEVTLQQGEERVASGMLVEGGPGGTKTGFVPVERGVMHEGRRLGYGLYGLEGSCGGWDSRCYARAVEVAWEAPLDSGYRLVLHVVVFDER
jgi:hypothetical protein